MAADGSVVVYLGLGSNQGERLEHLRAAVDALQHAGVQVQRASSIYESSYVGAGPPQSPYLNAVVRAATHLAPLALLDCAQAIERSRGREPDTHMQPRPLDIDLVFYGSLWMRHPRLALPHPRWMQRRFVLEPLVELAAPAASHPSFQAPLQAVRATQSLRRAARLELEWSRETVVV